MNLFLDCEYNDFKGPLISMALVSEDGKEWYSSLGCTNPSTWVAQNVMPIIGIEPVSLVELQTRLRQWLTQFETIHVIADWPEDIAHFCNTLITGPGYRLETPPLTLEVVRIDSISEQPHNALADAWGIRNALLTQLSKEPT